MSNRTFEANRAILSAWEREQELVRNGQGTRDWTQEQQQDILERGKAYDVDGRAFEGHHMKSAEAYPQYQGDPENIQFLSRIEHGQAHDGWQKPTNGYYDYHTGITYHFDEEGFLPCKIIVLSDPVIVIDTYCTETDRKSLEQLGKEQNSNPVVPDIATQQSNAGVPSMSKAIDEKPQKQSFKGTIAAGLRCVVNVAKEHPVLTTLGIGLAALAGTGVASIINAKPTANQGNSLLINPTMETAKKITIDAVNQFDFKKSESALKQLGYAVAKNLGLSDEDRRKILDGAIATAGMTKEAICTFLEKNISLHKNQDGFSDAVRKWTSDLAYLRNKP